MPVADVAAGLVYLANLPLGSNVATMTRPQFLQWRTAFGNLLDCAVSDRDKEACVAGWRRDAAAFIPAGDRRIDSMVGYYLDTRLRAPPAEREKYCRPLH
jgi:hypothetical protein